MSSWKNLPCLGALALVSLALTGCEPSAGRVADEEKEPQFLIGRSRVNAMDYQGAIEAFEQALETNPRSSAAHFELGWLYAKKDAAPAIAIYHYEKYLKLRPDAENVATIRDHIFGLKQELAKGVLPIPPSTEIQRQLEQLAEENRQLRDQLERLRVAAATEPPSDRMVVQTRTGPQPLLTNPGPTARPASSAVSMQFAATRSASRTHRVKDGETPMAIARRYNVKLDALLTANPGLDPRRMRVGQSLFIPTR